MTSGTKIAQIVDDTKLSSLYIIAMPTKTTSLWANHLNLHPRYHDHRNATVERSTRVERITKEGGVTFEVVFVMDNPGTLTAGMSASAELDRRLPAPIYPMRTASWPTTRPPPSRLRPRALWRQVIDLLKYANVTAGPGPSGSGNQRRR